MISRECFQREWILRQARASSSRNPVMLEKAILALQLLGYLVEAGLPLQFKGGTSLLLRLSPPRRLSIDVDIVTQATPDQLVAALEAVSRLPPFESYEHDALRDRELPPKKHFRLFYPSALETKRDHVLLDVLFEPDEAPHCEPVTIIAPFLIPEREVRVFVPTVNSLLGDKLTAFAPRTIGILHHELRRTDIVKQLFDVAALFDAATDLGIVADVYATVHARQLVYRQASFTLADTLADTIESGFFYSQIDLRGGVATQHGLFLQQGVSGLRNHLVNLPFHRDQARTAAGKASCTAAWIMHRPQMTIEEMRFRMEEVERLRSLDIRPPWTPLNRLKGANPEAFHYWSVAQQILGD
jgi:hypothetical protein